MRLHKHEMIAKYVVYATKCAPHHADNKIQCELWREYIDNVTTGISHSQAYDIGSQCRFLFGLIDIFFEFVRY